MARLLNALAPLARAATVAKTASLEGEEIGRERKRKTLLDELALSNQAEDRERRTLMDELTRRNIESQIADRERPAPRNIDPLSPEGVDATVARETQLAPLRNSAAPRNIDPLSPQGIDAAADRTRAIAGAQGAIGRSPRAPTAEQEKSYNWHQMMAQAAPVLEATEGKIRPDAIWTAINSPDWTAPAVNRFLTPEEQQYYQAIRSFGAGMLRKESGAAFGAGELADIFRRIGPTGGNAPETVAQIRAARKSIMDAMEMMATPARMYYEATQQGGVPNVTEEEQLTGAPGVAPGRPLAARPDLSPFLPPGRRP